MIFVFIIAFGIVNSILEKYKTHLINHILAMTAMLLLQKKFDKAGTDLVWFNGRISLSGMDLVANFEDDVICQIYVDLKAQSAPTIHLTRAIKARTAAVTKMTVNPRNSLLVTGAADRTIFVYNLSERHERLDCVHLHYKSFVQFDAIPNYFNWKDENFIVLIGYGRVYEYRLPSKISEEQTYLSYNKTDKKEIKATKFMSPIPSQTRKKSHSIHLPFLIQFYGYVITDRYTIWVSMGGYDAGYIYELQPGVKEPVHSTIIKDGDDCEIHSYLDRRDSDIGFSQCKLRINQINPTDFTDMRNYLCFNMFDPLNGTIPSILSSCDGKSLISVGYDGNIFIYSWFGPDIRQIARRSDAFTMPLIIPSATDIIDPNYPSLEQQENLRRNYKRKRPQRLNVIF
uniref:Uncharacterized protein n=1 Tax=Glossina palpalis gambiensis TaxID=67801 RepID=A0A1B0C0K6_9MUSC